MSEFDHETAAKEDIIARPEVTGEKNRDKAAKEPEKEPLKISVSEDTEPDNLEIAAGRVISKTVEELKEAAGMAPDADFSTLLSESLGGLFAAVRIMSSSPWVRFAVAGGAITFAFIPPFMRYMAAKSEEEDKKK